MTAGRLLRMGQVSDADDLCAAARRTWRALWGSGEAQSAAEQQEVQASVNREPWVHEVRRRLKPCASELLHK